MAKRVFQSVAKYIAAQPKNVQPVLQRVRATIRTAVPEAQEMISYHIPAYKLDGDPVLYIAAWKQHYSLYPATKDVIAAFEKDLVPYKVLHNTIRLSFREPIPVQLIARIARFRAKKIRGRTSSRLSQSKKR